MNYDTLCTIYILELPVCIYFSFVFRTILSVEGKGWSNGLSILEIYEICLILPPKYFLIRTIMPRIFSGLQ